MASISIRPIGSNSFNDITNQSSCFVDKITYLADKSKVRDGRIGQITPYFTGIIWMGPGPDETCFVYSANPIR